MAVRITRAGVALTVGIIVLTGLIIGGLFIVKENGEQARREEAVKIAEENLQQQSSEEVALNEATNDEQASDPNEATQAPTEDTGVTTDESNQPVVDEMPETGPAETASFFAVGLLAFATTAYYRSRRALLNVL